MAKVTLHSFLLEMGTWFNTPAETLQKAEAAVLTAQENKKLKSLMKDWQNGRYDECPEMLYNELLYILNQNGNSKTN